MFVVVNIATGDCHKIKGSKVNGPYFHDFLQNLVNFQEYGEGGVKRQHQKPADDFLSEVEEAKRKFAGFGSREDLFESQKDKRPRELGEDAGHPFKKRNKPANENQIKGVTNGEDAFVYASFKETD